MTEYRLDRATRLTTLAEGGFSCLAEDAYWNFTSAYGGWALAVALQSIRQTGATDGRLVSINAMFMRAIKGEKLIIVPHCLKRGAQVTFWRVQIYAAAIEPEKLLFSADMIFSHGKSEEFLFQSAMPVVPDIGSCPVFDFLTGPKWISNYRQWSIEGTPFKVHERPRSLTWIAEDDGRPWDEKGLVTVSDAMLPRIFLKDTKPRFGSTISYSLQICGSRADVNSAQSSPLLMESDSDVIRSGEYDQQARIWSQTGALLALTRQIGVFQ